MHARVQAYSACPVMGVQYDPEGVRRDAATAAVARNDADTTQAARP